MGEKKILGLNSDLISIFSFLIVLFSINTYISNYNKNDYEKIMIESLKGINESNECIKQSILNTRKINWEQYIYNTSNIGYIESESKKQEDKNIDKMIESNNKIRRLNFEPNEKLTQN